jgi:glycosyltransferase involved in cell wall biosynthesis
MNITVYCYDDVNNPRCGGGGAFRELAVHRAISARHQIRLYTGNFPGARDADERNFLHRHLGIGASYLVSRISFSLFATVHSLFSGADIIAIPFSIYSPVLTFLFKPRRTVVLFFHETGRESVRKYGLAGWIPFFMERLVLDTARNFITLTDSMALNIAKHRSNVRAKAGYVSLDPTMFSETTDDGHFVLCFGRIDVHMKGIDILISAFEKIADAYSAHKLVIAGRGKESDIAWVKQRIDKSPCRVRIQCVVNASDDEKKRLFRLATFVCMPSRFEGWNIAAIEAAASSKATIGSKISGLSDAIKDGETGILVPPENVEALAEKMALLLGDSNLRIRLGKNGYVWARKFTLERVAGIQEDFYREVFNSMNS